MLYDFDIRQDSKLKVTDTTVLETNTKNDKGM